jgi:hypothetical protein
MRASPPYVWASQRVSALPGMSPTIMQPIPQVLHPARLGSSQFTDMIAGQSPPTLGGSFPPVDADDYFSSSPELGSQEGSVGAATSPGSPSAIAQPYPTQIMVHQCPQQGISSLYPQSATMPHRIRKGKCAKQPKDLKATRRLKGQRKSDNENIEALYELFVPKDAEVRWKKDRLGTSTSQYPYFFLLVNNRL